MKSADELILARARQVREGGGVDVPSPCLSICRMESATGLCVGCLRTLDEIAAWGRMADAGKQALWQQLEERALERQARDLERT
jgi:predicted Fe-S protein YdhL (DUF1289 family)